MTAQILTSELSTLLQESKRKNPDIKSAVERSLSDLKALPRTSEAQIVAALDIQLKVLQAVPSLLQNYAANLTGDLLTSAFQVCFLLYGSKTSVVSNTAAATLQQLVNSTFEKASLGEDESKENGPGVEAPIGNGYVTIWGSVLDAYQLLQDISLLTEGQRAKQFTGASLAQNFGFELLESILTNHADTVTSHPELIHVLRLHLMPLILKILSEKASFSSTVRVMRLLQIILSRLLFALASECEMALSLLNHMLEPDAAVLWKRAMCLELLRNLHSEPALIRSMYSHYDEVEESRSIVRDHLGCLVRLASERPNIIGLGQQSSVPVAQTDDSGEQAAMQAGGFIGTIGASVNTVDINTPGISNRWSTIRTPCIDMLDKSDAPPLPATYIYSLTLACITAFSDGLARFLLPFTVPVEAKSKRRHTRTQDRDRNSSSTEPDRTTQDKKSSPQSPQNRKIPTNPLSLHDHVLYSQISTSSHMIDQCWPAFLAASSTFLNASMDSEHYHSLIRSFQKFTQIAGLLDLRTPRDAFLTTLGKHSVPSNTSKTFTKNTTLALTQHEDGADPRTSELDSDPIAARAPMKRQNTTENQNPSMNTRHLLCLRALLNLGIALGPFLQRSWSIILETLQQADLVIKLSNSTQGKASNLSRRKSDFNSSGDDGDGPGDLALEITAAETAASRMFESTSELPSNAFLDLMQCMCSLLHPDSPETASEAPTNGLLSPTTPNRKHQKLRSVSGTPMDISAADQESVFVLEKLRQVIESNAKRLLQSDAEDNGWDLLSHELKNLLSFTSSSPDVRIKASATFHEMAVLVASLEESNASMEADKLRSRSLDSLLREIKSIKFSQSNVSKMALQCEIEIHTNALDAARLILERCGDSLKRGWGSVFAIVNSIFDSKSLPDHSFQSHVPGAKLVRSSFASLQLICSDFLNSVPSSSLLQLLDTLSFFSTQDQDLNISLTAASLFRNISDFLLRDRKMVDLEEWAVKKEFDENDIKKEIEASSEDTTAELWLYLLLKLVHLSVDPRLEVRHSILRTLFGIFDSCNEQLVSSTVLVCFKHLLIKALDANEMNYAAASTSLPEQSRAAAWNHTVIVLMDGISSIFSQWLDLSFDSCNYAGMFSELLTYAEKVMLRRRLNTSKAAFSSLTRILSEVENSTVLGKISVRRCWQIWQTNNPAQHEGEPGGKTDNQDALLAYLDCLGQIIRLENEKPQIDDIEATLSQLRVTVVESTASPYSSDVDQVTAVQKVVLEVLRRIPTEETRAGSELLYCITFFVTLAYNYEDSTISQNKTFVALSKASMVLLDSFVTHLLQNSDIEPSIVLEKALTALAKPIHLRYHCHPEGKAPSPWQKATSVTVNILQRSKKLLGTSPNVNAAAPSLWESIVYAIDGILDADLEACDDEAIIGSDQAFDIDSYSEIREMIIPGLGSSRVPEQTKNSYVKSIFQHSIIHEPNPDDLARPGQELLEGFRHEHVGRVQDLPPSARSKLSYLLLDHLFDLVATHSGSVEEVRLSEVATPYLLLRIGLVLKAYIYDQPLRGLMPQPWTQKEEMFILLRKLVELDFEPKAISSVTGFGPQNKWHIYKLYPLLLSALQAAWRDEEMENILKDVLKAIGEDLHF